MPVLRFSACRPGKKGVQQARFRLYGADKPDVLKGDAREAIALDDIEHQNGDLPFYDQRVFDDNGHLARHLADQKDAVFGKADAPVIVFVHGFQFDVRGPKDNPHLQIFHFDEVGEEVEHEEHTTPWLARAFFEDGTGKEEDCPGLAVCFGYDGTGDTRDEGGTGFFGWLDSIFDFVTPTGEAMNFYRARLSRRDDGRAMRWRR